MVFSAAEDRYEKVPARRVSDSGLILPALSFGLWRNLGDQKPLANSREVILKAFDNGIYSFDNASNYGPSNGSAEETFGAVFNSDLKAYRDELVITTKAGYHMWPGPLGEFSGRKTLRAALDLSLQRMHLDYVDIFYAHRWDPNTNLEETAVALDSLVRQGKALYVGVSNYTAEQTAAIAEIFKELRTPFVTNQVSYNMLHRNEAEDNDMLSILDQNHAGLVAYGPLAEGLLTDRYLDGFPTDFPLHRTNAGLADNPDETVAKLNALNAVAADRGQTLAQLAMAWLLKDRRVASIVFGASSIEHLLDNIKVTDNLELSDEELQKIENILN
ncbi:aldo/keto reductase [Weissella koreensis]|uniref:Aldo/keto reductase n=1 Tax=Weissella koreensis TaxID=165096 RepID=A0A7H1MMV4_9LACO|nr:aldo/keto reductase [Weissella koreensis]AVH75587.1 aldo/keto reductase [Weissella koreensis]EJF34572.1 aldo/keto reductase family protein [Weissella koreensis KCTC 3621]QGN20808.1 aldo/keto reductase [Weissella koreensis]QNT64790.1 aldo/keto reductase [Weissella koreensis]